MTENQLRYLSFEESQRHNAATEAQAQGELAERARANRANEFEANRSNVARETETNRANVAKEQETERSNRAQEGLATADLVRKSVETGSKVTNDTIKSGLSLAAMFA